MSFLFGSESVSEGHPDKVADQISDAILDALLAQDKNSRVACECLVKTGMVLVAGEISTNAWVDIEGVVRRVLRDIGYNDAALGFDAEACAVLTAIGKQSPDIAQGVDQKQKSEQGAGDQGMMFGFACDETDTLMPAPIAYAHALMQQQAFCRKEGVLTWLGPDAKAQVVVAYDENHTPLRIDSVVLSTQHHEGQDLRTLREAVLETIIKPTLPEHLLDAKTRYLINPTGRFVQGGPVADCGLTGRKIIVDTYGGRARHGGGCFSGKDPSKVDRSAAYMARYMAKHVVAAKLASQCEIQLTYAIGVAKPVSICVDTFGSGVISDRKIEQVIQELFDCTPFGIIQTLSLLEKPIYEQTASYGHFGQVGPSFTWEALDRLDAVKALAAKI